MQIGLFCVLETPFGGLRGNVGRSSWARWKARSRLPTSVNWTFFARCYGWGAMSDYRLKIGDFAPTGAGWPKISGRRGRPHQPFFFSENYAKLSFVWCKNLIFLPFCHNTRVWQTDGRMDGRTDRQTEFSSLYHVCIACSAVKIVVTHSVYSVWQYNPSQNVHHKL